MKLPPLWSRTPTSTNTYYRNEFPKETGIIYQSVYRMAHGCWGVSDSRDEGDWLVVRVNEHLETRKKAFEQLAKLNEALTRAERP